MVREIIFREGVQKLDSNIPRRNAGFMRMLSREELLLKIESMPLRDGLDMRNKALICFIYLTGLRISEVVGLKVKNIPPIIKKQVSTYIQDNMHYLLVSDVFILKRRKGILKRNLPILVEGEDIFLEPIINYINNIGDDLPIFLSERGESITRRHAMRIIEKHTGLFPHYLRHLRATHLVVEFDLSDKHLTEIMGWKDNRMASRYTHLKFEDVARALNLGYKKRKLL